MKAPTKQSIQTAATSAARLWTRPEANEAILALYLRLNGYFTTGLIVHNPKWGDVSTEIDCLAVRHPRHTQPERQVPSSPFLALQDGLVDLLICDAKSSVANTHFNESLTGNPDVIASVLCWAGLLDEGAASDVAHQMMPLLKGGVDANEAKAGIVRDGVRVRGLLCCPPANPVDFDDRWCLDGAEVLRFADECLRPASRRDSCSTRYPFQLWGGELRPFIEYFKKLPDGVKPTLEGLYAAVGAPLP
jgi:hypothetical protein